MFRVDDEIAFGRKFIRAGNEAIGAWVRAGAWSAAPENLTEGWIPEGVAHAIANPETWERLRLAELVDKVDPDATEPGYQLHDYLDYNPSAEEVRARIRARSEAGRKGGKRSGVSRRDPPDEASAQALAQATASALAEAKSQAKSNPVPVPVPEENTHSLARERTTLVVDGVTGGPVEVANVTSAPPPIADGEDLITLAQILAAEGKGIGVAVLERAAKGWRPTEPQLATLRQISAERATLATQSPIRREPTDDEKALVELYLGTRDRTGHGKVVALDMHFSAARRLLPDLRKLSAASQGFSWQEVAKHRLEAFWRATDAKLEAEGYPLGWLLSRTDAAGLPVRSRSPPREQREPEIKPVIRHVPKFGGSTA